MKWTFASVGILIFGLFGIIIITFFNEITVSNEQDYYTLKEAVEASMVEAVDVTYYRLTGSIKIIQEKFVENFTRRFSQVATYGDGNYNIEFYDISESPPKVSVRIVDATATYNVFGTFGADPTKAFIVNEISAILDVYSDSGEEDSGPIVIIPSRNLDLVNVPRGALPVYKYDNKYYQTIDGSELSDDIQECQQYNDRIECLEQGGKMIVLKEVSEEEVDVVPKEIEISDDGLKEESREPLDDLIEVQVIDFGGYSYTKTTLFVFKDVYKLTPKYSYYLSYNGGTYVAEDVDYPKEATGGECTLNGINIRCQWNDEIYDYKKINGLSYSNSLLKCLQVEINGNVSDGYYLANSKVNGFANVNINFDSNGIPENTNLCKYSNESIDTIVLDDESVLLRCFTTAGSVVAGNSNSYIIATKDAICDNL